MSKEIKRLISGWTLKEYIIRSMLYTGVRSLI